MDLVWWNFVPEKKYVTGGGTAPFPIGRKAERKAERKVQRKAERKVRRKVGVCCQERNICSHRRRAPSLTTLPPIVVVREACTAWLDRSIYCCPKSKRQT